MTAPRTYWHLAEWALDGEDSAGRLDDHGLAIAEEVQPVRVDTPEASNLVGSLGTDGLHYPAIDLDVAHDYRPSSTAGHAHLLIDVGLPEASYRRLLDALVECGIVERGFASQLDRRGSTHLRQPWARKPGKVTT